MNKAKTSTIAVRGTVASIITGKVNCGEFATIKHLEFEMFKDLLGLIPSNSTELESL
jgi:hypothetical protein